MESLEEDDEEKYKRQFAKYLEDDVTADTLEDMYKEAHEKIRADPSFTATEKKPNYDEGKKYKTKKKMAQADGVRMAHTDGIHPVAYIPVQATDLGTTYIGYSFIDDNGDEVIYWFPYEMILDGDTGAVDYVPLA